jgi:hypothetical protein
MINYLFYRFSRIKIHRPTYWAKIIVCVIITMAFLPAFLTLSKYFGCYDQKANDGTIKLFILGVGIVVTMISNFYYSPQRIKKINNKYSSESKLLGNLKFAFVCLIFLGIFIFGSTVVRCFIQIPDC